MSFNQQALSRANKVMKLLQGQGAIDELGLGRIRDAFSNTMFPGMSVLQTHAKYFLLMPALYAHLEKIPIADARAARALVREQEIRLTYRLVDGSPNDAKGIIGADFLKESRGAKYVKYDPAYVYQAGMETYGFIPRGGNLYALLAERSAVYQNIPKKHKGNVDSGDDSDDLTGRRQLFSVCGENYGFDHREPLDIKLTHREAEFLKNSICRSVRGSLLAYLLESGLFKNVTGCSFDTLGEVVKDIIPGDLYKTYTLALRFSRFAHLLRMRYAMLYDIAVGADTEARGEYAKFNNLLSGFKADFSPEAVEEIIHFVSPIVTEDSCKSFVLKASKRIAEGNPGALDQEIALREKAIKGLERSKLINAKEFEHAKPFDSPVPMAYRWNTIVRTVLSEIKEGLGNG